MNSKEMLLGLILVKEGLLTRDQLKKALLKQGEIRRFGRHQRLGEVICKLGFMSPEDLVGVLEIQKHLLDHGANHTPLGLLLIEHGMAQPSQVYDALVERQFSESRLGELLIEKGLISEAQLTKLLEHQHMERANAHAEELARRGEAAAAPAKDDSFVIFDAGGDDASLHLSTGFGEG